MAMHVQEICDQQHGTPAIAVSGLQFNKHDQCMRLRWLPSNKVKSLPICQAPDQATRSLCAGMDCAASILAAGYESHDLHLGLSSWANHLQHHYPAPKTALNDRQTLDQNNNCSIQ